MKKFELLILFIITITGCSLDNGNQDTYDYEVLPVDSYTLPENFKLEET